MRNSKPGLIPDVGNIAKAAGLHVADVAPSLDAMDGVYAELKKTMGDPSSWCVVKVTPERRAVGQ